MRRRFFTVIDIDDERTAELIDYDRHDLALWADYQLNRAQFGDAVTPPAMELVLRCATAPAAPRAHHRGTALVADLPLAG